MPKLEPKCCECRWLRYVEVSKAYCCGSPDSPCSSNVDAERKADTAPAWCPRRKEGGE